MDRDELLAALLRERFGPDATYRPNTQEDAVLTARKTGILAAAAILTLGALTGCPDQPPRNMPPCAAEDGGPLPCYHDAEHMGSDPDGDSYWIGEDGQQHTVTHDQAHRWWDRDQ